MNVRKIRERNIKIYKIYKPFAWDLLCYYAISFLFEVNVKGFTAAQVLFADAFYPLFKIIIQPFATIIIPKIGKRRSLVFGNICLAIYTLILMGTNTVGLFIFANFFCAMGFVFKELCETNILMDSLENNRLRNSRFAKIDGKANARYYYLDAIFSVSAGFLYLINPYVPMVVSMLINLLSAFIAYNFRDIPQEEDIEETEEIPKDIKKSNSSIQNLKNYLKDLWIGLKFIFTSKRLKALMLFNTLFLSVVALMKTVRRSLMSDIGISSDKFGIILAIIGLIGGFASSRAHAINEHHKNHTLEFLGNIMFLAIFISGLVTILDLPPVIMYFVMLSMFTLQRCADSPYNTIMSNYLGSFANSDMRIKITSVSSSLYHLTESLTQFLASFILTYTTTAYLAMIIAVVGFLVMLLCLKYMKTRLGLRPEEYPAYDTQYDEIQK